MINLSNSGPLTLDYPYRAAIAKRSNLNCNLPSKPKVKEKLMDVSNRLSSSMRKAEESKTSYKRSSTCSNSRKTLKTTLLSDLVEAKKPLVIREAQKQS